MSYISHSGYNRMNGFDLPQEDYANSDTLSQESYDFRKKAADFHRVSTLLYMT